MLKTPKRPLISEEVFELSLLLADNELFFDQASMYTGEQRQKILQHLLKQNLFGYDDKNNLPLRVFALVATRGVDVGLVRQVLDLAFEKDGLDNEQLFWLHHLVKGSGQATFSLELLDYVLDKTKVIESRLQHVYNFPLESLEERSTAAAKLALTVPEGCQNLNQYVYQFRSAQEQIFSQSRKLLDALRSEFVRLVKRYPVKKLEEYLGLHVGVYRPKSKDAYGREAKQLLLEVINQKMRAKKKKA